MAKTVNYGDAYTHRITLRVTDAQMQYLVTMAEMLGVSPSEYVRMTINMGAVSMQKTDAILTEKITGKEGKNVYENVKTNQHDIVQ